MVPAEKEKKKNKAEEVAGNLSVDFLHLGIARLVPSSATAGAQGRVPTSATQQLDRREGLRLPGSPLAKCFSLLAL